MKTNKLILKKFTISKLNNLSNIRGGSLENNLGDDDGTETRTTEKPKPQIPGGPKPDLPPIEMPCQSLFSSN